MPSHCPWSRFRGGESRKGTDVLKRSLVALLAVLLVGSCLWAQATQPAQTPADLGRLTRMGGAAPGTIVSIAGGGRQQEAIREIPVEGLAAVSGSFPASSLFTVGRPTGVSGGTHPTT